MQHTEFKLPTTTFTKSCDKCGHLPVCSIFRAFAPLMRNEFENDMPIEPTDMAQICNKFIDARTLQALEEGM